MECEQNAQNVYTWLLDRNHRKAVILNMQNANRLATNEIRSYFSNARYITMFIYFDLLINLQLNDLNPA